jgi:hypothetical protein
MTIETSASWHMAWLLAAGIVLAAGLLLAGRFPPIKKAKPAKPSQIPKPGPFPFTAKLSIPSGSRLRLTLEKLAQDQEPEKTETVLDSVLELPDGQPATSLWLYLGAKPAEQAVEISAAARIDRLKGSRAWQMATRAWRRAAAHVTPADGTLFLGSLGVYLLTRLIGLTRYPIYFFTDEAVQTVLAADFVRDGFHDYLGHLFPTYFQNVYTYNLNLSVYAQILPYLAFGKSVLVTRATAALLTLLAALAIGLMLKRIYHLDFWWAGVLLLALTPAWFLHSRMAFETTLMVSLYACGLYTYLLYRTEKPGHLFISLTFFALAFYSYSAAQPVILGSAVLLAISDWRYHWQHRALLLRGFGLLILLGLPLLRFQLQHPGQTYYHLRMLDSYWLQDLPLAEKLSRFAHNASLALSPDYWYFPNTIDLIRHRMGNLGHMLVVMLPLTALGLGITLRRLGQSPYRAQLAVLLAAPLGGAMVGIGITRVLSLIIPLTVLSALGLDMLANVLGRLSMRGARLAVFAALSAGAFVLLNAALTAGPTWFHDYGIGGMQYGGIQVFGAAGNYVKAHPGTTIYVSPTWANGADVLRRFFLADDVPVYMGNADSYLEERKQLDSNMVFVLTASEYSDLKGNAKITASAPLLELPYPDGSPGFEFATLSYTPQADAIFAAEALERQKPRSADMLVDGREVHVEYPLLDEGRIEDLFDGDTFTLGRTFATNPARIAMTYSQPQALRSLNLTTGSMDFRLQVELVAPDGHHAVYDQTYRGLPPDPTVTIYFDQGPASVRQVILTIYDLDVDGPAKIHIREIDMQPARMAP